MSKLAVKQLPAGFWIRLLAILIDALVIATGQRMCRLILQPPWREVFSSVLSLAYTPVMLYYYQATLGKLALDLKVVSVDGKKLGIFQVLLREWIGKFISAIVLGLGFLWVAFDKDKRGWHDKLAGTKVVKT
ncbi:MAG TPA: RDD family protein [Candidatus Bathyarchaeia archaeon]|nr:RDD family protein [Candidatus Bathyarchaeia archaeon]